MAISKLILNGDVQMDVTSDTVSANRMLNGYTATKNDGTKVTGNIATKSAADMTASGSTVTAAAGYYATATSKNVGAGSAFTPAVTITKNPTISLTSSTGAVTASYAGSSSVTPTVTAGYVATGTAGTVSTSGTSTYQLTSKAAATYNTSTADQTIGSYRWLTGNQTIKSVTTSNLTAGNIASGVTVKVGDANNASRITQVTGTLREGTPHTATIKDNGNSSYCYVQYNGTKYYTANNTFTFYEGDTLTVYVKGTSNGAVFIVGAATKNSTSSTTAINTTYLLPGSDIEIWLTYSGRSNIIIILSDLPLETPGDEMGFIDPTEEPQYYMVTSSAYGFSNFTVNGISPTYVGTDIARRDGENTTFTQSTGAFYGPSGYYTEAFTRMITTQAAQTIYPSTADQTIASYRWLTGTQTFKSVTTTNLTAANIVSGTVVKVGDSGNASRITQVTGTFSGIIPTGTSNITSNGTYDVKAYASASVSVGGGEYYNVYKSIALNSDIRYDINSEVREFCNSLSKVNAYMFANRNFYAYSSSITFLQVTQIEKGGFCYPLNGGMPTRATDSYHYYFPACTSIASYAFQYKEDITGITGPLVEQIGNNAFNYIGLLNASFPACTSIGQSAFANCTQLTSVNFSACTLIGYNAFVSCEKLISVNFPVCSLVRDYAFRCCSNLTSVSFPICTSIGYGAFDSCSKLISMNFSSCILIGTSAFNSCFSLTIISFPACTSIGQSAFNNCTNLTSVNFPACTSIGYGAFSSCFSLTTISFSACTLIGAYAFANCSQLTSVSFPTCTSIGVYAFRSCYNLIELHLESVSSVPTLSSTNAFQSTPLYNYSTSAGRWGSIFVPASLYASFQTATNWSNASIKARLVSV